MTSFLPGESSNHGTPDGGSSRSSQERPEEGGRWYMARKEIEENSPSRRDGIDLKKETYIRKSYCTFLQDFGMRLKVPQVTIATAIIFCHRFFLRQSHAKNDRRTIATVCMFLAGKVEETPRPLKDVILVSYEIIHKRDPNAAQKIKQKEVYEQQKEVILIGERVLLATLDFDLNVHHPYKPLVEAIKKFKVAQNALAQVAWNFVNDGLRTSLCLQFKPHHIAAGAIFLAAKFLKVKLPSDGEKVWWQEFDVTPRQLEEVSNQMLELYEQNRVPPSQGSEVEGSAGAGPSQRNQEKTMGLIDEHASKQHSSRLLPDHSSSDKNNGVAPKSTHNSPSNDNLSADMCSVIMDQKGDVEVKDAIQKTEQLQWKNSREQCDGEEEIEENGGGNENTDETGELKDDSISCKTSATIMGRNSEVRDASAVQSPKEAIKMIDRDRVKAALEKRRKNRGGMTWKKDLMDEDDLIERELEDGVELAVEDEKNRRGRRQDHLKNDEKTDVQLSMRSEEEDNAEEGEMLDDGSSSLLFSNNSRKRKGGFLPDRPVEKKERNNYAPSSNNNNNNNNPYDSVEDEHLLGRSGYADREHRRHVQEQ